MHYYAFNLKPTAFDKFGGKREKIPLQNCQLNGRGKGEKFQSGPINIIL